MSVRLKVNSLQQGANVAAARSPLGPSALSRCARLPCRVAVALSVIVATAAAEPTSIPELLARQAQFSALVGSTFQIEGRASTFTSSELRMKGTDLKFVFESPQEKPRSFPYVQLTGRLDRDGRDFHIVVQSLSAYKSETEVIKERLRAADTSSPETYYTLAQWAEDRGKFYEDESLHDESRRLRTLGVRTAQQRTPTDRPGDLLALADRVSEWNLAAELRMELLHAATRADLNVEAKNRQPAYSAILNKIKTRFPGADQPLADLPEAARNEYLARPEATYAKTDVEGRPLLHRLLYLETVRRLGAADLKPDGSNGYAVAATVERLAPELEENATQYRARELDYLESQVSKLDRVSVLDLRNKLREAGQADRGTAAVRTWIDQQLSRRPKSPATDIDRAQLEFEMVGDTDRALALASAALTVDPKIAGGVELLALMGYGWYAGKAVRTELIPAHPPDPFEEAIKAGRLLVGMNEQQARAVAGDPTTIVRLASQGRVAELWHYPSQRLTLHLDASRQKPQLAVSKIVEQAAAKP